MPLTKTGMYSLEVFSLSVVLDFFINIVVLNEDPSLGARLVMDGIAFLLLSLTALTMAYRSAMVKRQGF